MKTTRLSPTSFLLRRISSRLHAIVALALAAFVGLGPAQASTGDARIHTGVVLGVYPEESSAHIVDVLRLPTERIQGGRFAIVKLANGAWGEGSFALVYVPRHIAVAKTDAVELERSGEDLLSHPGKGVVSRVISRR